MSAEWTFVPLSIMGMLIPFLIIGLSMAGGALLWGYWKGKQTEDERDAAPTSEPEPETDPEHEPEPKTEHADIEGGDH